MLTNFLTKAPPQLGYFQRGIQIEPVRLQAVVPGLQKNLKQACCSYVEGLADMDQQFLKNTTSPYLFSKILPELHLLKSEKAETPQSQFARKIALSKSQTSGSSGLRQLPFKIFPYVVFAGLLPQRLQQHPFKNLIQVTRNRFISKGVEGIRWGDILKSQTYGFRCVICSEQKLGYALPVTFEGNIDKQEYSVVDFGDQLLTTDETA